MYEGYKGIEKQSCDITNLIIEGNVDNTISRGGGGGTPPPGAAAATSGVARARNPEWLFPAGILGMILLNKKFCHAASSGAP